MVIPDALVSEVRSGRVVLFLGAGASYGATTPTGDGPLLGSGLRDVLSERFLGGSYNEDNSLAWVSELAIGATDLATVQDFVADRFRDLEPADFHRLLPTFRWRGLATTNYDRLTERIYETTVTPVQEIAPFISNRDRVDDKLRSPEHLGLLKLHGCVTRTHDPDLPLILTVEQYATHRAGRNRLFSMLYEWGAEHPIVFVGHSLQDHDLRTILLEISKEVDNRPRYYLIKPDVPQVEKDLWGEKRVTVLDGTFEDFLRGLDDVVPKNLRPLVRALDAEQHPIQKKMVVNEPLSYPVNDLLQNDAQYVHPALEHGEGKPELFYKGFGLGWYPIATGLDVRRRSTDTVLWDVIARPEKDRPTKAELYVVKAEAGAGKTIFLRRVAWEAATQSEAICLFARPSGAPRFDALRELHRVTRERIFLFVDAAADNSTLILQLIEQARRFELPLTVITAERVNEWNMSCGDIDAYVSGEYRLEYLDRTEIEALVNLLDEHGVLGPNLRERSREDQINEFEERAGRQLLVALHEATLGRTFEEILLDEYENVHPKQAQNLYLTVCLLNRLGVPVRAGLISRVHGIRFEEFREKFFAPLEHVVNVVESRARRDLAYVSRHPEIAQIVFDGVLIEPTDRYNEYVRVLKHLNISYSSDRDSFRKLVRARSIHELFPNHQDAVGIFDLAQTSIGEEAYLLQQMANYERIRPNGNLAKAHELLEKAQLLDPRDTSIVHTLAEVARARANNAEQPLERHRLRNESRALLRDLVSAPKPDRYSLHTIVKLALDDLKDVLKRGDYTNQEVDEAIRAVERTLQRGRQQFPDDYQLSTSEAQFRDLLNDHKRSQRALESAFETNPRDPYIATRLARSYEDAGDLQSAETCLRKALQHNRGDKQLNFRYAQVLRSLGSSGPDRLAYHFRRAFTKWDNNHEAQFWYARYAFESDNPNYRSEAEEVFQHLRDVPMHHDARHRVRDLIATEDGRARRFFGTVSRKQMAYGFAAADGRGDDVFFHRNGVEDEVWDQLRDRSRIAFDLGFTFSGPQAVAISLA